MLNSQPAPSYSSPCAFAASIDAFSDTLNSTPSGSFRGVSITSRSLYSGGTDSRNPAFAVPSLPAVTDVSFVAAASFVDPVTEQAASVSVRNAASTTLPTDFFLYFIISKILSCVAFVPKAANGTGVRRRSSSASKARAYAARCVPPKRSSASSSQLNSMSRFANS